LCDVIDKKLEDSGIRKFDNYKSDNKHLRELSQRVTAIQCLLIEFSDDYKENLFKYNPSEVELETFKVDRPETTNLKKFDENETVSIAKNRLHARLEKISKSNNIGFNYNNTIIQKDDISNDEEVNTRPTKRIELVENLV